MDDLSQSVESAVVHLAAEALRRHSNLRLRVHGSSMLPAVRPDDTLVIRHCPIEAAASGDIVLFVRHGRLFAHRVTARLGALLLTQGDGNPEPDALVDASEFLGRVVGMTRRGRTVRLPAQLNFASRGAAAVFRRSPLAGRLFTRAHGLLNRALA